MKEVNLTTLKARVRGALNVLRGLKDDEALRIGGWNHGNLPREHLPEIFPGLEGTTVSLLRVYERLIGMSLDASELLVLVSIAKHLGAKQILEVGTFDGNTALNLADCVGHDGRVTTIDLPPTWSGAYGLSGGAVSDNSVQSLDRLFQRVGYDAAVGRQFQGHPHEARITQVLGDSATLDWSPFNGQDLVFIDGNHSYDYVRSDTENAVRVLRSGGLIVWHDYGMIGSVSRYVDERRGDLGVRAIRGTRFAVGFV